MLSTVLGSFSHPFSAVHWPVALGWLGLCYLLGSIPTGYLVAKQAQGIDIREHGSGNVGATNVLRVCGKKWGILTYVLDALKGILPVAVARVLWPDWPLLHMFSGFMLVIGHSKSVFLNFTGGKSAMTGVGALFAMSPLGGLLTGLLAGVVMRLTKTVSIGSMVGAACGWIITWALGEPWPYVLYIGLAGLFVIIRHKANIARLLSGTENRL